MKFLFYYVVGQRHVPAALSREREPVFIVLKSGWTSGPVWALLKILQIPTFEPRTVHSITSRYPISPHINVLRLKSLSTADILVLSITYISCHCKATVHLTLLMCPTKNPRLIGRQLPSPAVWRRVSNMKINFLRQCYLLFHVLLFPKLWCCLPNYTESYPTRCQTQVFVAVVWEPFLWCNGTDQSLALHIRVILLVFQKHTVTITDILSFLIKFQLYSEYNIRKLQVTVCVCLN